MKRKIFLKIPKPSSRYVNRVSVTGTKELQNEDGTFFGRMSVKGPGKSFDRRRVAQDFVLVKQSVGRRGHTRKLKQNYLAGQFI